MKETRNNATKRNFHKLFYGKNIWKQANWRGIKTFKCPLDLFKYQEIIFELRPSWIIECGTAAGGSALFFADICEIIKNGNVISIDISEDLERPYHSRIEYLLGSSIDDNIIDIVRDKIYGTVMVILDSDHCFDHVIKELNIYSSMVNIGSYIIVEDTNINGNPVLTKFGKGPMEAVKDFLSKNSGFKSDDSCENFLLTFNPNGYLRRIR